MKVSSVLKSKGSDVHPLNMRLVAEKDSQTRLWVVFDSLNGYAVVGVHKSETLAVLDAFKREQDSCQKDPLPQTQHKTAA